MLRLSRTLPAWVLSGVAGPAAAHGIEEGHTAWCPDFGSLLALATLAGLYTLGWRRMGPRRRAHRLGRSRAFGFATGLAVLAVALLSPLDRLAEALFSAHMGQHLLLMGVAPPLLAWGRFWVVCLWALPLRERRRIGRFWRDASVLRGLTGLLDRPLAVGLLASFALWFWHLPVPYALALHNRPLHILEHLSFLLTALAFWTLVVESAGRRRFGYGMALVFVAAMGMQESLLGALLTFAAHPLYPVQKAATGAFGLTPLEDQELAGLLMWVPAGLVHLGFMSVLFLAWFDEGEMREVSALRAARPVGRHGLFLALLATLLGSCSDEHHEAPAYKMAEGDTERAPALIRQYGCGTCHRIPGVEGAQGGVGPPLGHFAERAYVAGVLPNTPANLMHWIRNPQSVVPGNAMPDMGVTEQDARDIAAYLYTLR